ncbi:MAG TPA: lipoate--protein ligase [Clostridiales bacterium]|nr:lipoate--protein ligase [Clostridiales bacterium]
MANETRIIRTSSKDPWWNLAVEEYLLERVKPDQCILYIWQNEHTVVIGRNQNPWRECRTDLLESDGGKLARRLSGGGAVYHDSGNLNYTFVTGRELFDTERQFNVILSAVRSLGIEAGKSGRNDLVADGRKFSGNAFCIRKQGAYQHGTILVSADVDNMSKYLQVSEEKMRSKGVKSVRSRVVNLTELNPGITVDDVAQALIGSFRREYGSTADVEGTLRKDRESCEALEELYCKYSSWAWRYGEAPDFDVTYETRFPWGGVEIGFMLRNAIVSKAIVYSDAMDAAWIESLAGIMEGMRFNAEELANRILGSAAEAPDDVRAMAEDLACWLRSKSF